MSELGILKLTEDNILSFTDYLGEELPELFEQGDCFGYGLLEEDTTAGVIFLQLDDEEHLAQILQLYVDKEVRRSGGGILLLHHAAGEAALMGASALAAELDDEEDLEGFFTSVGFQVFDRGEDRTALYSLEEERDPEGLFLTEDQMLYDSSGRSDGLPLLMGIAQMCAERGFEGEMQTGEEGQELLIRLGEKKTPVHIRVQLGENSNEYGILFTVVETFSEAMFEKALQKAEENLKGDSVSILPEKEEHRITYMMGISESGGLPEEEHFFQLLAQFLEEIE